MKEVRRVPEGTKILMTALLNSERAEDELVLEITKYLKEYGASLDSGEIWEMIDSLNEHIDTAKRIGEIWNSVKGR